MESSVLIVLVSFSESIKAIKVTKLSHNNNFYLDIQ